MTDNVSVRRWLLLALGAAGIFSSSALWPSGAAQAQGPDPERPGKARNVILFWGDGNSDGAITAGRLLAEGADGSLALDSLPSGGDMTTHAANSLVTDSAASATAAATGQKTNNGAVGVDPSGEELTTVLELAKAAGKATGIVSTSYITDASTAAFAAHVASRSQRTEIARQVIELGPEVVLGGGENDFLPTTVTGDYPGPGSRTDGRNLIAEAEDAGYSYLSTAAELANLDCAAAGKVLGLFGDGDLFPDLYLPDDPAAQAPSLKAMTDCAIAALSTDPDGFFLVVEEEGIDELAHDNLARPTLDAELGFDAAVAAGLGFARPRNDSLVIVTADHETGGLSVMSTKPGGCPPPGQGPFTTPDGGAFCVAFLTRSHTGEQIHVAAEGPYQARVEGGIDNTDLFAIMRDAMHLD